MKPTDTPRTHAAMSLKQNYELSEKDCPVYENYVHAEVCAEIERELAEAKREAEYLATALNRRYYAEEAPNWGLCDSVAGVISQIDNMAAGLGQRAERAEKEVERLKELVEWYRSGMEGCWYAASTYDGNYTAACDNVMTIASARLNHKINHTK